MDVKFVNTTSSKLSGLAITDGQLVALSDKPGLYYDLGGARKSIVFSDNYTTSAGTAASGVGASSYAVNSVYKYAKSNIDYLSANNTICYHNGLTVEVYCNMLWIYGGIDMSLSAGWNDLGVLPIDKTMLMGCPSSNDTYYFNVIDNTATTNADICLEARVSKSDGKLILYSFKAKSLAQLRFNAILPMRGFYSAT